MFVMAEGAKKTKEEGEEEKVAEKGTGQATKSIYSPTPGQMGVLCQWQGWHSPCYKSMNCKKKKKLKTIVLW